MASNVTLPVITLYSLSGINRDITTLELEWSTRLNIWNKFMNCIGITQASATFSLGFIGPFISPHAFMCALHNAEWVCLREMFVNSAFVRNNPSDYEPAAIEISTKYYDNFLIYVVKGIFHFKSLVHFGWCDLYWNLKLGDGDWGWNRYYRWRSGRVGYGQCWVWWWR